MAGDTDLWYHLNAGRYFFEHGRIAPDSFFSFISPPRPWVDYFWLFQALVFALYRGAQYYGLLALRATLFALLILVVFRFLFTGTTTRQARAWATFLFVLACLIILPRYLLVRPHMATYLLIAVFLYVLECYPQRARLLPALAVVWCNLHGIAYPILLWLCGAYVADYFWRRWRGQVYSRKEAWSFLVPTVLSMLAVYCTPHGLKLLSVPFTSLAYAARSISELAPLTLTSISSFHVSTFLPEPHGVFNVVLIAAGVVTLAALLQRTIRLSHLLLVVGGAVLMLKGLRFMSECTLLCLPLLKANPLRFKSELPKATHFILLGLLLMLPVNYINRPRVLRPQYPFSHAGLPQGVATFLNHLEVGGSLLNDINVGGYLQWELFPRYRIFADMQTPHLFTDEDLYMAQHVFTDPVVLEKVVARYAPAFIGVPIEHEDFRDLVKAFPAYSLVWFDDTTVLYADRTQHPDIASRYVLAVLDPFELARQEHPDADDEELRDAERSTLLSTLNGSKRASALAEVARLLAIDPGCRLTNTLMAEALLEEPAYGRALGFAQAIITHYPEQAVGYRLLGDGYRGLKVYDAALAAYQAGIDRADAQERRAIHKGMGQLYLAQQQWVEAFNAFLGSVDLFSEDAPVEELYRLAVLARAIGRTKDADALLTYLSAFRLTPADVEWHEKLRKEWARLGRAPLEATDGLKRPASKRSQRP